MVDAIAAWSPRIVEKLYLHTNGQVDKPFPAVGDLLAVYVVESILYPGSPQGWFIVTAKQFKSGNLKTNPHFWCHAVFHPDIPPIPDSAVPWHGAVEQNSLRERMGGKSVWLRLCTVEINGCSYYNLSDWIKAKRELYDAPTLPCRPRVKAPTALALVNCSPTPRKTPRRRRRRDNSSEYIIAESVASTESDLSDVEFVDIRPSMFGMTTGKMSHGSATETSASTSASSSLASTPRRGRQPPMKKVAAGAADPAATAPLAQSMPRYMMSSQWLELREETQRSFVQIVMAKTLTESPEGWLIELAHQLEAYAVFTKCKGNQDRYIGLSRTVTGVITSFPCLIDSIEAFEMPISDTLREKLSPHLFTPVHQLEMFHDPMQV